MFYEDIIEMPQENTLYLKEFFVKSNCAELIITP